MYNDDGWNYEPCPLGRICTIIVMTTVTTITKQDYNIISNKLPIRCPLVEQSRMYICTIINYTTRRLFNFLEFGRRPHRPIKKWPDIKEWGPGPILLGKDNIQLYISMPVNNNKREREREISSQQSTNQQI